MTSVLVLAMTSGIAATATPDRDWKQLIDEGRQFERQGSYSKADASLRNALAKAEHSGQSVLLAESLNELATLLLVRGEYPEAERLLLRAIAALEQSSQQQTLPVTLGNLARCYSLEGEYDRAEALCRRSIDLENRSLPRDESRIAAVLDTLAAIRFGRGDYFGAETTYRQELAIREKQTQSDYLGACGTRAGIALGEGFRQYQIHPYPHNPLLQHVLSAYLSNVGK